MQCARSAVHGTSLSSDSWRDAEYRNRDSYEHRLRARADRRDDRHWHRSWIPHLQCSNFHQTDTILVGIVTIGILWLLTDRLVLQPIERWTVERWGLVSSDR
jgi:hypothetical protein